MSQALCIHGSFGHHISEHRGEISGLPDKAPERDATMPQSGPVFLPPPPVALASPRGVAALAPKDATGAAEGGGAEPGTGGV